MGLPGVTPTLYGSAQNKTAAGTVVVTTTALIPADTLLVMAVCADNVAAATPTITSITNVGGGTWTNQAGATTQSGATTTAGTGVFVYAQTLSTTSSVANGTNITVTFNASPVGKAVVLVGFAGMSTLQTNAAVSAGSIAGTPSAVSGSLKYSDVAIGVIGQENSANSTVDTDTTAGSWAIATGLITTGGGGAATNCAIQVQYKAVNALGAQTFDPPGGANDAVAIVFPFRLAAAAKVETFTENFSGDLSKWSLGGSPTIVGGRLKLDHLTAAIQQVKSSTFLALTDYSLVESSVYAEVVPAAQPTGTGTAQTNFTVNSMTAATGAQFNIAQTSSARNLQMLTPTGGPAITQITYDPVAHRWLRLRHSGGVFFYDTSPDGVTWTNRGSTTPSPGADTDFWRTYVQLQASQITTNYGESSYFDNVNVAPTATTGQPKVYSGSAFAKKPAKVYSGSSFVAKPVKVWTGSTWKTLT